MATEIKTWQITNGKLVPVISSLPDSARKEDDLERWIKSNPEILGDDIDIIGEQVQTKSGRMDFLGIDSNGNTVIIELERNNLAREALAQAIDYASDIANWNNEQLSEICFDYSDATLEQIIGGILKDTGKDELAVNITQRILLIGFSIDESLSRMIEWLSTTHNVSINAIMLSYTKTTKGDEILSRTAIIEEDTVRQQTEGRKFRIEKSDEPGQYDEKILKEKLTQYFSNGLYSSDRIKEFMLPTLLAHNVVSREELKVEFARRDEANAKQAGYFLALISSQLGFKWNDFLRQVIRYNYPNHPWEKDNFSIPQEYRMLVQEILDTLKQTIE